MMTKNYPSDDWDEPLDIGSLNAVTLSELIEDRIANMPKRSTKVFKVLKVEVNELIDEYNKRYGKIYKRFD